MELLKMQHYKKQSQLRTEKYPAGPDRIHRLLLRETVTAIALPLTLIFTKSLQEAVLPQDWKDAVITPLFKKGARSLAENYRLVSLTSTT
jgi:hypothetical protein